MIQPLQYARFTESVHTGLGSENVTLAYKVHLLGRCATPGLCVGLPGTWESEFSELQVKLGSLGLSATVSLVGVFQKDCFRISSNMFVHLEPISSAVRSHAQLMRTWSPCPTVFF